MALLGPLQLPSRSVLILEGLFTDLLIGDA